MQRRTFSLGLGTFGALSSVSYTSALAQKNLTDLNIQIEAGENYRVLERPVPTNAPAGKVEVIEFFGYWCSHCNAVEPKIEAWEKSKPSFIEFSRVPVPFGPAKGLPYQQLYYTLLQMGVLSKLHNQVFATYHIDRKSLNTESALIAWAKSQGLDEADFKQTLNSFGVHNSVRRASQLVRQYGVEAIPSMGIGGKYYVDSTLAQGQVRMLFIAQALATQLRT